MAIYLFAMGPLAVAGQLVGEVVYWLKHGEWFHFSASNVLSQQHLKFVNDIDWIGLKWLLNEALGMWLSLLLFAATALVSLCILNLMGENQ